MNHVRTGVMLVLLGLTLSGCYISVRDDGPEGAWVRETDDWRHRQERNEEAVAHLELGRPLSSITSELGAPDMTEAFVRDGHSFRVLFYRSRLMHEDGRTTRNETTPLVFVDGELVGWGESAIEYALP